MASYRFDDRNIRWHKFGDFTGLLVAMFDVDEEKNQTDFIVKFAPGDAHREGGGTDGCIVFYNVRGESDRLADVLDDELNAVETLRTQDFEDALDEQRQT